MFAWVEISDEKKGRREIQYSLGKDMSLDGRISYDCRTGEMQLECSPMARVRRRRAISWRRCRSA